MKSSRYNVYVDAGGNHSFVFNPMTGAILNVDRELQTCLEKNEMGKIDAALLSPLEKCGIVVSDDLDEVKVHQLKHNLAKYGDRASSFLVFTTYACNLACPYCYEGPVVAPQYRGEFMGPEMTAQVVEFIKNQTLQNKSQMVGIGLYGGEPLLNVDCCETLLREVSHWCGGYGIRFYTTITTNGTLLTESVYRRIGKYLASVHVTLDGPQKFHDRKRVKKDGSGSYADTLDNLRVLKDTKEHLSVRINFDEENKHAVGEVLDDLEERGFKGRPHLNVYFAQVIPQDSCLTFPSDPEHRRWRRESIGEYPPLMQMAREKGWRNHMASDIGQEHSLVPVNVTSCDYVKHGTYAIDPLGDIYICPATGGHTEYRVGRLLGGGGGVEWNPSYYHIVTRDPSVIPPCNTCEVLPMCGGGCSIASYFKYKDYHTTFCNFTRELIYERLKAHLKLQYPEKFSP